MLYEWEILGQEQVAIKPQTVHLVFHPYSPTDYTGLYGDDA